MFNNNPLLISWEKARSNVFRLQRRILKSVSIGDFTYALKLQKLLLISNSARLLSIRSVVQAINGKESLGLDNKFTLTFVEKFHLNNFLLKNANNWIPANFTEVVSSDNSLGTFFKRQLWSISDRCWQCLVRMVIEPSHEFLFSPRNFSFYGLLSLHKMQKVVFLNLTKESYGLQKRVLIICFPQVIENFSVTVLLKKILAPRSIKLGIFRFIKLGLKLDFSEKFKNFNLLGSLLVNVLLNDIDYLSNSIRVGNNLLFFLKPSESELFLSNKILKLLTEVGIDKV